MAMWASLYVNSHPPRTEKGDVLPGWEPSEPSDFIPGVRQSKKARFEPGVIPITPEQMKARFRAFEQKMSAKTKKA